jgi:hypothetical protein
MFVRYYRIDLREIDSEKYEGIRLVKITRRSPLTLRKQVEMFARYFKREFQYTFIQFCASDEDNYTAYLFTNPDTEFPRVWAGACCFRIRDYEDIKLAGEGLQWIWIHPYFRSKGMLTEVWPELRKNHGDFDVERPISPAMKAFLLKHNQDSVFYPAYKGEKPDIEKIKSKLLCRPVTKTKNKTQ